MEGVGFVVEPVVVVVGGVSVDLQIVVAAFDLQAQIFDAWRGPQTSDVAVGSWNNGWGF